MSLLACEAGSTEPPGQAPAPTPTQPPTPAPDPAPRCRPTGGGPYWLLEGETVSFEVKCGTGMALDGKAFAVERLPEGAVYDPASRTATFTPRLDQAAVYDVVVRVAQTSEVAHVKLGVADDWASPANVPVVDPLSYTEEYGLPVLFLSPGPSSEEYAPATVVHRGKTHSVEAKLRGAASLDYPKNSYTIEFPRDDKFDEPGEAGGFENRRKIVLISTFDDNSYVRQRLAFDLWNRLDPGHIQIKTYSAVVYLDGRYLGLYTVGDHVDGFLMEDHDLSQDGNLYKAVSHDANFALTSISGGPKQTLHDGYVKKEGTPDEGEPGAFTDLEDLVRFVGTSDPATFLSQLASRIDVRDYEDWWIFVTLIMADDSAGKNSYHYHDPASNGVFRYAPWDFNASFGQTWQTERERAAARVDYLDMNLLFRRFQDEPSIGGPLRARYDDVLHGALAIDAVQTLVDGYVARIDASARRDERMWQQRYRTYGGWSWRGNFTTYDEELSYLRAWLTERWRYQDDLY
jgi:spore coat protein H